jgi:hypothetical protein
MVRKNGVSEETTKYYPCTWLNINKLRYARQNRDETLNKPAIQFYSVNLILNL